MMCVSTGAVTNKCIQKRCSSLGNTQRRATSCPQEVRGRRDCIRMGAISPALSATRLSHSK